MIQSPLLGYSAFSQLLQRCAPSTPMTSPPGALGSALGGPRLPPQAAPPPGVPQFLTSSLLQHLQLPQLQQHQHLACPSPPSPGSLSSVSPSPSSSPPTSLGALSGLGLASGHGVKSFTIDAILGLSAASSTPRHDGRFLHQHYALQEPVSEPSSPTDLSLGGGPRPPQQLSRAGLDQVKKQGGGGKCKRVRTIFTADQLERLEAEFERQQYMVGPERLYLAHALNLTEAQVKVWFQNRRIKWRKQHLEVEQQRLAAIKQHPQQQQQPAHLPHPQLDQDDDEHSEDSVMSEDRTCYFPSMVMPNGLALSAPDDHGHREHGHGLVGVLAARAPPEHDMQAPAAPPAPSEDRDDGDADLGPLEHRAVQ